MESWKKKLGWAQRCSLCGRDVVSYHNPEPLRDGRENVCDSCNLIVRAARIRLSALEELERKKAEERFAKASYDELGEMFKDALPAAE